LLQVKQRRKKKKKKKKPTHTHTLSLSLSLSQSIFQVSVSSQSFGPCTATGKTGQCLNEALCTGSAVASQDGANGCQAFASSVKCCVNVSFGACSAGGKQGLCVASCASSSTFLATSQGASGCQSFANDVKCCIPPATTTTTTSTTSTTTTTTPSTSTTPSITTTTTSSLPAGPTCVAYGRGGSCINKSLCAAPLTAYASVAGGLVTGCEPFASAIQCCSPGAPPATSAPAPGVTERVPAQALDLIKQFEGFFAKAYPDPLSGGKPITIGWGSTRTRSGGEFHLGDTITRDEGHLLLVDQLTRDYIPPQERNIPGWFQLNANQRSAIISFAYNMGAAFYGRSGFRTISNVLASKDWSKIRGAFLLYRNAGTNVEAGLRRRRTAEADLFLKPITNSAGLEEEPVAQVDLTADDDVDHLDPALHGGATAAGATAALAASAAALAAAHLAI
jgi:GH24 family phage-related lysozyme (muramidase)